MLLLLVAFIGLCSANHEGHQGQGHFEHQISYNLPGQSHVYVSRTFNTPMSHQQHNLNNEGHNNNYSRSRPSYQTDYSVQQEEKFSPFNPRYQVRFEGPKYMKTIPGQIFYANTF